MSERQFRRAAARRLEESARRNRVAAGVAAGAGAVVLFAPAADAATFMVTSLADDGSVGTLRTAIETANTTPGADTITFASGLSGTIQLNDTDGAIEINSDPLDIQGPGPSQLTVRGVTRPAVIAAELTGAAPGGFTARGTVQVDRTAFGVTAYRGLVARQLDLTVEIRCVAN